MAKKLIYRSAASGSVQAQKEGQMLRGAKSITLFGSMKATKDRIKDSDIYSDWEKVGGDLRKAMGKERFA